MMQHGQLVFLFAFFTLACGNPENAPSTPDSALVQIGSDSGLDFASTDTGFASTDYIFNLNMALPPGFFFDTIEITDTTFDLHYTAYVLQSSEVDKTQFNASIKNIALSLIEADREWFKVNAVALSPDHEMIGEMNYSWELGPFEINIVDQTVSLCCLIDTYSWGGNHHNHRWRTFNYNLELDSLVSFQQVFALPTTADSVGFQTLIQRHQADPYTCTDWHTGLDSVDFSFVKRGICFNPNLSWACAMQRTFVPYDSIRPYLHSDYKGVK